MAGAPKGNKNAVGNKGGKPYSKDNREKAATLKGLVLDWATKVMKKKHIKEDPIENDKLTKQKELVISKILPTCVPRPIEVSGEDGESIKIGLDDKTLKLVDDFIKHRKKKM